jgi:hypothetical protein
MINQHHSNAAVLLHCNRDAIILMAVRFARQSPTHDQKCLSEAHAVRSTRHGQDGVTHVRRDVYARKECFVRRNSSVGLDPHLSQAPFRKMFLLKISVVQTKIRDNHCHSNSLVKYWFYFHKDSHFVICRRVFTFSSVCYPRGPHQKTILEPLHGSNLKASRPSPS